MLVKRELIAIKIESGYKTDANPTAAANALLVSNVQCANESARMVERENIRASLGSEKAVFAGTLKKITFEAEVKGSGAAGTAPEMGQALRACGLSETIVASTSVTYAPVSASLESATIYYYQDGMLVKLLGCRGTVSISAETGGIAKAAFEFTGHDGGKTAEALPAGSYDATVPPPMINANFAVGGYGAIINALSLEMANTLVIPPDMNADNGFGEVIIASRKPAGSFDPEKRLPATKDFEAEWQAGTEFNVTTGVIGSTAGNRWQLSANIAYTEVADGDRDGIRTNELSFQAIEQTTDDEFSLSFT